MDLNEYIKSLFQETKGKTPKILHKIGSKKKKHKTKKHIPKKSKSKKCKSIPKRSKSKYSNKKSLKRLPARYSYYM